MSEVVVGTQYLPHHPECGSDMITNASMDVAPCVQKLDINKTRDKNA